MPIIRCASYARERLLEDDQLRLVHQRRGKLRALLVAVRELLHLVQLTSSRPQQQASNRQVP
jgi:hypothetical protein